MRQIVFSSRAAKKLNKLLEYLEEEWSSTSKQTFIKRLDKALFRIAQLPESAPISFKKPGLHKYVITKQTSIYYRFRNNRIQIVSLIDNRQDPKKSIF